LEIAGKTGTTNDNSDAWFMGYTPQLMAGGWVGADDRMIHFSTESKNGEGGRAAMPIWAYFMKKVAADPNCGLDTKIAFAKPDVMTNDITIDYINGNVPVLGGEGGSLGTGTSGDYDVPKNITIEDIKPESDINLGDDKKLTPSKPIRNNKDTSRKNNEKLLIPPANTPEKKKAVMPPPVKKPGTGK